MGYLIKYGTSTIFEPGSETYKAHDVKISHSSNGWATLNFTIPGSHPLASSVKVHDMTHIVEVWYNEDSIFRGIVTSVETTFYLEKKVSCASELIYLSWVYTRYSPSDNRPGTALAELIGIYNNEVDLWGGNSGSMYYFAVDPSSRADYVGYLDTTTGNNACDAETSTPMTILDILNQKIVKPYGAYLHMTYDTFTGTRYLGIYDTPPESNTQTIKLGKNLMDYGYRSSDDSLYTACYPVGGTVDEGLTRPAEKALKIGNTVSAYSTTLNLVSYTAGETVHVNSGDILIVDHLVFVAKASANIGDTATDLHVNIPTPYPITANKAVRDVGVNAEYYDNTVTLLMKGNTTIGAYKVKDGIVYHNTNAQKYGLRCMTFQDSDIKDATTLMYRAIAAIAPYIEPTTSLSVKAVDTALYDSNYHHLKAGQTVKVKSDAHGLDATMYVTDCTINLDDPSQTRYTLGTAMPAITRALVDAKHNIVNVSDNLITEMNSIVGDAFINSLQ